MLLHQLGDAMRYNERVTLGGVIIKMNLAVFQIVSHLLTQLIAQ